MPKTFNRRNLLVYFVRYLNSVFLPAGRIQTLLGEHARAARVLDPRAAAVETMSVVID